MSERPLLTAQWRNLLLLNFTVPVEQISRLVPPGTEPDLHDGQAYISIVGFRFERVRLIGIPIPAHTRFDEINLRFYVRRLVGNETRRAVVFVREIVPRLAIALVANSLYNENYVARPMRNSIHKSGPDLAPGDTIDYAWQSRSRPRFSLPFGEGLGKGSQHTKPSAHWNRLAARVATRLEVPPSGSLEEFIVEHYWGYVRGRDGQTNEYRVAHPPWRVASADNIAWECDLPATYNTPLAEFLAARPHSALIADGSPVQVFRGRRL